MNGAYVFTRFTSYFKFIEENSNIEIDEFPITEPPTTTEYYTTDEITTIDPLI